MSSHAAENLYSAWGVSSIQEPTCRAMCLEVDGRGNWLIDDDIWWFWIIKNATLKCQILRSQRGFQFWWCHETVFKFDWIKFLSHWCNWCRNTNTVWIRQVFGVVDFLSWGRNLNKHHRKSSNWTNLNESSFKGRWASWARATSPWPMYSSWVSGRLLETSGRQRWQRVETFVWLPTLLEAAVHGEMVMWCHVSPVWLELSMERTWALAVASQCQR